MRGLLWEATHDKSGVNRRLAVLSRSIVPQSSRLECLRYDTTNCEVVSLQNPVSSIEDEAAGRRQCDRRYLEAS